ncbi:unnamed protein product [Arabidopsis halleri]
MATMANKSTMRAKEEELGTDSDDKQSTGSETMTNKAGVQEEDAAFQLSCHHKAGVQEEGERHFFLQPMRQLHSSTLFYL